MLFHIVYEMKNFCLLSSNPWLLLLLSVSLSTYSPFNVFTNIFRVSVLHLCLSHPSLDLSLYIFIPLYNPLSQPLALSIHLSIYLYRCLSTRLSNHISSILCLSSPLSFSLSLLSPPFTFHFEL